MIAEGTPEDMFGGLVATAPVQRTPGTLKMPVSYGTQLIGSVGGLSRPLAPVPFGVLEAWSYPHTTPLPLSLTSTFVLTAALVLSTMGSANTSAWIRRVTLPAWPVEVTTQIGEPVVVFTGGVRVLS